MNIKQYKYVITLAKESSFSKAADVLNITQPSLSQYIKKIEKGIGLELFDRTNGYVKLTDAGRIYIEAGQKILDIEHRLETSFADLASYKTGSIIIGAAPYRAASMMPLLAKQFQSLYPGMHLVVREGTTAELVEGMERGEYDLALTLLPIDNSNLFSCEKVVEEELILAVPAAYTSFPARVLNTRKYPAIEAMILENQPFVMLTDTQFMQKQLEKLLIDYNLTVRPAAIVKSLEAQIEMVKAGVGMALVPSGIEWFCKDSEVTFYSFTDNLPKREVVVIWRRDRKLSKVAEELIEMIHSIKW